MTKRSFLSVVLIAILSSCAIRSAFIIKKTTAPQLEDKTIVLNYIENRSAIILPVYINGKEYRFVFDTGAQATLISKEIMDEIGLKEKSHINISDVRNAKQKLHVSILDSIRLSDELSYSNVGVLIYDFNKTPAFSCLNIDGVIGTNIIRSNNWKIDFDNHKLDVSSLEKEVKKTGETIALPFTQDNRGVPYVDLFVNGKKQQFMLDMGKSSDIISLSPDIPITKTDYKSVGYSSFGLFGQNKCDTISYGSADLTDSAKFTSNDVIITHSKDARSLIGVGFLDKFYHTATFDYNNDKLLLEKREKVDKEIMDYPISAVVSENNLTISSKDITLSDIQIGDTIVGINKIDFDGSNTCDLVNEFQNSRINKETITLKINRQGVISESTFSLHPIHD